LHDYQRNRILAFAAPDKGSILTASNITYQPQPVPDHRPLRRSHRQGLATRRRPSLTCQRSIAQTIYLFCNFEELGFLGSITVLGLFGARFVQRHSHRRGQETVSST